MIKLYDNCCYVLCVPLIKTGGTELLHQLVFEINHMGGNSTIVYDHKVMEPTPQDFRKYITSYMFLEDLKWDTLDILVIPENMIDMVKKVYGVRKVVWWLSVDNFLNRNGYFGRMKYEGFIKATYHLLRGEVKPYFNVKKVSFYVKENWVQSYYAKDFLEKNGIRNVEYLSDYINDIYLEEYENHELYKKQDIVLYNPKKGWEFTRQLIKASPEINWTPIQNMNNLQVREIMRKSKVYIDFGNHPGKDRIPREAVASGCCVITGLNGSASFYGDLPIKNEYKYESSKKNIPLIIRKIKECIYAYETKIRDFDQYLEFIKNEKYVFSEKVRNILDL